jgi:hypothetical protein
MKKLNYLRKNSVEFLENGEIRLKWQCCLIVISLDEYTDLCEFFKFSRIYYPFAEKNNSCVECPRNIEIRDFNN